MAVSLYCSTCDVSVWSSAFYAEGPHRCLNCDELLVPSSEDETAGAVVNGRELEA